MSDDDFSPISAGIQPNPADFDFDLKRCLQGVVSVRTQIPEDALTASVLGTERSGHGVVINDQGLVLTIGYIVTEAETVWLVDHKDNTVQGHVVAYDQESGFGLVQALGRLDLPVMALGQSKKLKIGERMVLAGAGGTTQSVEIKIAGIREFAGYWEYLLDEAIFTAPAHPSWGGAALIGQDGRLYGIGSLILQTVDQGGDTNAANMVIPIDLLPPILDELMMFGKRDTPPRPWLGWYVQETREGLVVAGVVDDGPADTAGLEGGDTIIEVNGTAVDDLPDLYRNVWTTGLAGVDITITFEREDIRQSTVVKSIDRGSRLKTAQVH